MKMLTIVLTLVFVGSSTVATNAQDKETTKQAQTSGELQKLGAKLKKAVAAGELSKEEALAKYKEAAGEPKAKAAKKKSKNAGVDLEALGAKLKEAVAAGKLTEKEAIAKYNEAAGEPKAKAAKKKSKNADVDLETLGAKLKEAVAAGKLTKEEAIAKYNESTGKLKIKSKLDGVKNKEVSSGSILEALFRSVEKGDLTADEAMKKFKSIRTPKKTESKPGSKSELRASPKNLKALKELSTTLPKTSTGDDKEGPVSTFIFGWAANATHRFLDNSHTGKPRKINGLSFRLDHREHAAIGRTWENVKVRVAHGDFSSISYNRSTKYELIDEPVVVFDQQWSFPALTGFPPLEPASWGGPQNSLSFRFDEPFEYNGKDAIYVEFKFSGGTADDGREWKGELPKGFEYFLDSMPEIGGWRIALEDSRSGGVYRGPARVAAVTSYTAGGQSVWTSSPKGMPFIRWDE